jgi:hypothetical protein
LIVVIASELDDTARDATADWPGQKTVLLTPADFFCRGWRATAGKTDDWSIVADNKVYSVRSISGIITLLPRISAGELFDVEPDERSYAAAEASAFALFFLTEAPCPVVNRPTPDCLTGPNWRPEQWMRAGFEAGIRTKESKRTNRALPREIVAADCTSVTVLAGKCLEDTSEGCLPAVQKLAELAQVIFLKVYFTCERGQSFFAKAELTPDLSRAKIRSALSEYFSTFELA